MGQKGLFCNFRLDFSSFFLGLEELIKASEIYKKYPDKVCMQYVLLVPESCEVRSTLDVPEGDIVITREEVLEFKEDIMGKDRTFKPTLYKLKKGEEVRAE